MSNRILGVKKMSVSTEDLDKEMNEKKNAALAFCRQQISLAKDKRDYVRLQDIFFEAIEEPWDEVAELLINNNVVSVNSISPVTGENALMFAASNLNLYIVDLLLEKSEVQKEIHLSSGNALVFIDLDKTKLDAEAFQVMMNGLMQHKELTTLYISWQKPELNDTVKEMLKRLKTHGVLHNIVLVNNQWGDEITKSMMEVSQSLSSNHINKTQKNMLEGIIKLSLGSVVGTFETSPLKAISALESMKATVVDNEVVEQLRSTGVWDTIEDIRKIFTLARPQNRAVGDRNAALELTGQETRDGVVEGIVYFYSENGEPASEEQGLLTLTTKNNPLETMRLTAPPITKAAVIKEVLHWIDAEILEQQIKLTKNVEAQKNETNKPQENDGSTKDKFKP
jgi:hypothetical protein